MVDRRVIEKIFTGPSVIVHTEDVQEGRFACPGRTHHGNEIALGHIEVDVAQNVKRLAVAEGIRALDVMKANHVL
jgi:hypothetical protein